MEGEELRRFLTIAAVAAMALVGAAPASAQDDSFTFGDAAVLGPVHVRGDVAQVHARYSCDVGNHIWVSAKQSDAADIDPAVAAEGLGSVARTAPGGRAIAAPSPATASGIRRGSRLTRSKRAAADSSRAAGRGCNSASRPTMASAPFACSGRESSATASQDEIRPEPGRRSRRPGFGWRLKLPDPAGNDCDLRVRCRLGSQ